MNQGINLVNQSNIKTEDLNLREYPFDEFLRMQHEDNLNTVPTENNISYNYLPSVNTRRSSMFEVNHIPLETIKEEGEVRTEENTVSPMPGAGVNSKVEKIQEINTSERTIPKDIGQNTSSNSFFTVTKNKSVTKESQMLGRQYLPRYSAPVNSHQANITTKMYPNLTSIKKAGYSTKTQNSATQPKPTSSLYQSSSNTMVPSIRQPNRTQKNDSTPLSSSVNQIENTEMPRPPRNVFERLSMPITRHYNYNQNQNQNQNPPTRKTTCFSPRHERHDIKIANRSQEEMLLKQLEEVRRENVRLRGELDKCKSDLDNALLRIKELEREKKMSYRH